MRPRLSRGCACFLAWAAANIFCDAAAVAVRISAGPAEPVAAQPANRAGLPAPVKLATPTTAAARTVLAHRVVSVQASATDATDAAPLEPVAAPATAVATAPHELSAEACKWIEWRFTLKRVVQTTAQSQEFTRSAAGTAPAFLFACNGLNWGGWRGAIQAALATIHGSTVMAVSNAAAATAAQGCNGYGHGHRRGSRGR